MNNWNSLKWMTVLSTLLLWSCITPRIRSTAEVKSDPKITTDEIKSEEITATPIEVESPQQIEKPQQVDNFADGVPAEQSLGWLKNGNTRFVKGWFRSDGRTAEDRSRLISAQKPHAIVLSCSDSRVPPEHIFDQGLGEIFTIRVAGEALDKSVIASIEYAATALKPKLLVVLGHNHCGAVATAIATHDRMPASSENLENLVADIGLRVINDPPFSDDLSKESLANARGVAADLLERSNVIKDLVDQGQLKITSALYYLESGEVEFDGIH